MAVRRWVVIGLAAGISACSQGAVDGRVAQGKLVSVGKKHLIMKDARSVMFVDITPVDREQLKGLKKGEEIILLGRAREGEAPEVDEVVRSDGTHVPLGQQE